MAQEAKKQKQKTKKYFNSLNFFYCLLSYCYYYEICHRIMNFILLIHLFGNLFVFSYSSLIA